jgi:hypothetical protein
MYATIRIRQTSGSSVPTSRAPDDLRQAAEAEGVAIEPMHPGVDDPELARWFYAEIADPDRASALSERLRELPSVDAAYITPPEGPPGFAPQDGAQ